MRKYLLLLSSIQLCVASQKHVIGMHGGHGLFSIFLGAVNNIYWADKNGKTPVVYWKEDNLYYQPQGYNGADNPWDYYFEPVSEARYEPGDAVYRHYQAPDNFMVPPNTYNDYFYNELRFSLNQIIERYIKVRPEIMSKVDQFYADNMAGKVTIGVHLRGTDKKFEVGNVDHDKVLTAALDIGAQHAQYHYFVATDEQRLLDLARQRLGNVICCDTTRSQDGWPVHYTREKVKNRESAILGEQVLIDTLLLSKCDYLVHTASNVASAALLFNPWLTSRFLSFKRGPREAIISPGFAVQLAAAADKVRHWHI